MCHMDPSLSGLSHVVEFANNRSVKYQQAHAVTLSGDSFRSLLTGVCSI